MPVLLNTDAKIAAPIRCLLTDVDGVLTDGRIVYDDELRETKRFHVHDGVGIKLWMKSGFSIGILTARRGPIVTHRAGELGITAVRQGYADKLPAALEMIEAFGATLAETCYIGDDLPDIPVMCRVGLAAAPADASCDARAAAHWVMQKPGGGGVIRELTERLLRAKDRWEEHVGR